MTGTKTISVGVIGTSWWADAMHVPALDAHPNAMITAICGRNEANARKIAARWNIPGVYTDAEKMIAEADLDAVIVTTGNDTHYPFTMRAIERGLHVLCEKPLALNYADSQAMAEAAEKQGIVHMVPFTYSFMPSARYLKELIDGGYIGTPFHLNMRYYTGYGLDGSTYHWRFNRVLAGSGVLGDLGSHFLYLGRWLYGEIDSICVQLGHMVPRPAKTPDGESYEITDDTAMMLFSFSSGAQGAIHVSSLCHEGTSFGQTHHMEFHGTGGTLYSFTDWDTVQQIRGTQPDQGPPQELPIPDHIWEDARRDTVHNTYRDIFRKQDHMTRGFITAIIENKAAVPDFHDGARIQRIIEAGLVSHRERRWVDVDSVG